jgi:FixJ family two-component response regulator
MVTENSTVFVVDDDEAVRDALCRLFSSVDLTAEAFASGEKFLTACGPEAAGCVVIDLRMPGMSAFEVQEELAARAIDLPVIFLTGYGDVETGVRAMKAGAVDFIQKPFKEQALLEMVQKAMARSLEVLKRGATVRQIRRDLDRLTPREREVLAQIVAGEPDKRIAHTLGLSEKTVEFHRANLMKKMKARSLADLIQKALRALPPGGNP